MLRAAGAAIFAADCPCCRQPMGWGRYGVCESCWSERVGFSEAPCDLCGRARKRSTARTCAGCSEASPACSAIAAWGPYEGRLRGLIHALKYEGCSRLARPLGEMIAETLVAEGLAEGSVDVLIVPVPPSRTRAAERGYNQSLLLAREVGRVLKRLRMGSAGIVEALARVGEAPPQTGLSRKERLTNLLAAYRAAPGVRRRVAGRQILLIDDVITTGATVEACSRALRGMGAIDVIAGVIARTPSP